jgi:hypothetical protein
MERPQAEVLSLDAERTDVTSMQRNATRAMALAVTPAILAVRFSEPPLTCCSGILLLMFLWLGGMEFVGSLAGKMR